jgi:glyoxylase-like metal-dependent hydrolase (beta-lactamase superfamily II)
MQRTTVGTVEVFALVDTIEPYPAATVYPAGGEVLRGKYARYLDSEGRIALNFGCFLAVDGEAVLLVDTGWGPEHGGGLLAELAAAGVSRESVTMVLFTHLHGDHTGWRIDRATGRPTFPNARYLVPRLDWHHYSPANNASFERDVRPLEAAGRLELIEGERNLSSALTALATPGHTPGHTSVAILSGAERGFILGDVVISALDAEEPTLESIFDWDKSVATATRKAILARLVTERALVGASHLPAPGLGHFVRDNAGQRWQAL